MPVYGGRPVEPEDQSSLERLAVYILRPSFAGTRLRYPSDDSQIEYRTAKDAACSMDALDWIARVSSHVPAYHEHLLRYDGRYFNAARDKGRKKEAQRALHPTHGDHPREGNSQAERFSLKRRRSRARLLKKICEVDPLTCGQWGARMEMISCIDQPEVIHRILRHLNLWERPQRFPPPRLFPHQLDAFLATLSPRQVQQIRTSTDSVFWDDVPTYPDFQPPARCLEIPHPIPVCLLSPLFFTFSTRPYFNRPQTPVHTH